MKYLGAGVDVFHALAMITWIAGMPLLFWHRYPKITLIYCAYTIVFIMINIVSQYFLGECVLTTLARYCWSLSNISPDQEWFSVRFSKFIFGLTPTHNLIKRITETLILIVGIGIVYFNFKKYIRKSI